MKLSEKGEGRLYNSKNVFYDDDIEGDVVALWELSKVWEFEPEDFTGAVVLTVEEAEKLMKLLDLCEYWLTNNNVSYDCDAWASLLEERIEQAEKKK